MHGCIGCTAHLLYHTFTVFLNSKSSKVAFFRGPDRRGIVTKIVVRVVMPAHFPHAFKTPTLWILGAFVHACVSDNNYSRLCLVGQTACYTTVQGLCSLLCNSKQTPCMLWTNFCLLQFCRFCACRTWLWSVL